MTVPSSGTFAEKNGQKVQICVVTEGQNNFHRDKNIDESIGTPRSKNLK